MGLHAEHEARDPRYRLAPDAAQRWANDFRVWTQSEADRIWLATRGDDALGLLTAHLYEPTPTFAPMTMVYVDDLYVAVEARGVGLAHRLLAEARAWGAVHGARQIRAGVLAANALGRSFWAREGAADFSVTVTIELGASR
jgi:GNAT superfamily N-acetyltransferase